MGRFGDDFDKNYLYEEIISFLEEHTISELLEVVTNAVEHKEDS